MGVDLHIGGGLGVGAVAGAHDVESAEDGGGGKEEPVPSWNMVSGSACVHSGQLPSSSLMQFSLPSPFWR